MIALRDKMTWLIAGLGNPGLKYENNWHNTGYKVLEILAARHQIKIARRRGRGLVGPGNILGKRCLLLKPVTYMNLSGESVRAVAGFYKIPAERCLVIYDDIDLPVGQMRIRKSGGAGTHNGMRSVVASMGREDFPRIRVGIGPLPPMWDIVDYVLSDVPEQCSESYREALGKAADAVEKILGEGLERAMNQYNQK